MNTSQRTLFDLDLVWLCMYGIHFPTDPMMDRFLSSVCVCACAVVDRVSSWGSQYRRGCYDGRDGITKVMAKRVYD